MNLASFLIFCLIVTFSPGPTNILILNTVQNFGINTVKRYILGATISFGMLLAGSVVLNSALAAVVPILSVVRVIGTLYMLYLAYQIFKMDASKETTARAATFLTGFLMQLINPKVVLFALTVIPSHVMPYYQSPQVLSVFVAAVTVIGFLAFAAWALFGRFLGGVTRKSHKASNVIMAMFLVYSAVSVSGLLDFMKR
jgi:cysteine/O-acetylserine efflux protein